MHPVAPMRTERLALRPIALGDLAAYHALLSNAAVAGLLKRRAHASLADSEARLRRVIADRADGTLLTWAIARPDDDAMIGFVGLCRFDAARERAELFFELLEGHQRRGLATEAVARVVQHAFDAVGLTRVEGHVDPDNARSIGVLARAEFARERVLTGDCAFERRSYDTVVYARTRAQRLAP